jgi:hypothetical protein
MSDPSVMDFVAAGLSTLMNVLLLALFVAGVSKLFQIHSTLTEIKDSLRSRSVAEKIARPTSLHTLGSGDEMLRALDVEMRDEELRSASPH